MTPTPERQTYFASAERAQSDFIFADAALFKGNSLIQQLYDALNTIVVILNEHRQIVFVNQTMLKLFNEDTSDLFLGKRPGEAFDCIHAREVSGCGTTQFCRECGAVKAILTSQREHILQIHECRILRSNGQDALNLRVCASPLSIDNHAFTVFSIEDTSDSERRKSLERIFFHDIMNTAIGVRGLGELLEFADTNEIPEYTHQIYRCADTLVQEIESQRDLLAVENRELNVTLKPLSVSDLLSRIQAIYQNHEVTLNKTLCVEMPTTTPYVNSDRPLLERVVGNMVKNALEACKQGETVTLKTHTDEDHVVFVVHNPGVIPESVQLQLFQRSFSTKGTGRGLGTYSMKLISERYLNGAVSFLSNEQKGTEFYVIVPAAAPSTKTGIVNRIPDSKPQHLPLKILIVEDVPVNLKIVKHMIAKHVDHVDTAANGKEAVEAAISGHYDGILMDVDLPDISGIDATRQILSFCKTNNLKTPSIIGVTAHRLDGDIQECLNAGMTNYVTKPVEKEEILQLLSELC